MTMQKQKVLFIASQDNYAAQMAERYLLKLGGNIFDVRSTYLSDAFQNAAALYALVEDGLEYEPSRTHKLRDSDLEWADQIVVIGSLVSIELPELPTGKQVLRWEHKVSKSERTTSEAEIGLARANRDSIKSNVNKMLSSLMV